MFNIPDINPLYDEVVAWVKEHQGEKGYIDCQPFQEEPGDTIYGIIYEDGESRGVEKYVYGVRVVDDDLQVVLEDICLTWRTVYAPEDFTSEDTDWYSVRWGDVYFVPTLFNIAECIEEYGE